MPFTSLAAVVSTNHRGRNKARMAIQPAGQHDDAAEPSCFASQISEDRLDNVLSDVFIPTDAPNSRRVNELHMTSNKLAERLFRGTIHITPQ
jgi:hypothetical protein